MPPRKRVHDEMEDEQADIKMTPLNKLRNMWEFACITQYIFIFGKAVKLDDSFDIEDFEKECMSPTPSTKLEEIGLTLLKWISSHRGLTFENWDEYARRQYVSKAPHLNPYGTEDEPKRFRSFDIFSKIRVLHQLTVWTFWNPDRIRERMPEQKETDQTLWRIEELGWDAEERAYFVLDDSRLYRRTDPPLPAAPKAKPKANTLKAQAARRRANKRRRMDSSDASSIHDHGDSKIDETGTHEEPGSNGGPIDTFGGYTWECIAISSQQYNEFLSAISRSRDANERELRHRIVNQVLPVVEKSEESQRRKWERQQKELLNTQKMMTAKRSSRLADKFERERQEREAVEAAEKHAAELAAAHKERERQTQREQDRKYRVMTREQRIKDREYKRLLHEEELEKISKEAKRLEAGEARGSERHLKAQMEKHQRYLEGLVKTDDRIFDCSGCGVYGKNLDGGQHSVACENCHVWQHSGCLGIQQPNTEEESFHFVCQDCRQGIMDSRKPAIKLKLRASMSESPHQAKEKQSVGTTALVGSFKGVEIPKLNSQDYRATEEHGSIPYPAKKDQHLSDEHQNVPSKAEGVSAVSILPFKVPSPSKAHLADNVEHEINKAPINLNLNGHACTSRQLQNGSGTSFSSLHNDEHVSPNQKASDHRSPVASHSTPSFSGPPNISQTPNGKPQGRLPSPVVNRPSMSPTQGNVDVGPLAGIPQDASFVAPLPSSQSAWSTQESSNLADPKEGSRHDHDQQGTTGDLLTPQTDTPGLLNSAVNPQFSHAQYQPKSGLSPVKHSPAIDSSQEASYNQANSFSVFQSLVRANEDTPRQHTHHAATNKTPHLRDTDSSSIAEANNNNDTNTLAKVHHSKARSISGTPVFPPSEKETLRPRTDQFDGSPMPTPSKSLGSTATNNGGWSVRAGDDTRWKASGTGTDATMEQLK